MRNHRNQTRRSADTSRTARSDSGRINNWPEAVVCLNERYDVLNELLLTDISAEEFYQDIYNFINELDYFAAEIKYMNDNKICIPATYYPRPLTYEAANVKFTLMKDRVIARKDWITILRNEIYFYINNNKMSAYYPFHYWGIAHFCPPATDTSVGFER